jgi:tRNA1(Val) A37 N6-methylase TrmN6
VVSPFLIKNKGEMTMMFPRLARNFIKNGYFPTDEVTLARILNSLAPATSGKMTIFDPTAGEGVALAECKQHLGADRTHSYGIEIDEERAYHAKTLLDDCIHGNLLDCIIPRQSFGLLFFNPPYGDLSSDKTDSSVRDMGRERLEKTLYRRVCGLVQSGGVMVMIVPQYALDKDFAKVLSTHWQRVRVFLALEQKYKQIVFLGVRGMAAETEVKTVYQQLVRIGQGELPAELPAVWSDAPYVVSSTPTPEVIMQINRLDDKQLAEAIQQSPGLWTQFVTRFERASQSMRRPLMDLSQWHLALALAAGQVSGLVKSQDGRSYLIRGSTYKIQQESVEITEDDQGQTREEHTFLDRFIPVLRALDMTPGSNQYGQVLTLK